MNEATAAMRSEISTDEGSRRRWLKWARVVWVLGALVALGVLIAAIPGYLTIFGFVGEIAAPPEFVAALRSATAITSIISALISLSLAAILFLRKWEDWMAVFVSFYLLGYGIIMAGPLEAFDAAHGLPLTVSVIAQTVLMTVPTLMLFYLFPSGHFVPRWTRWLALASLPFALVGIYIPNELAAMSTPPAWLFTLVLLMMIVAGIYAQIYRNRYVSTPAQRQQTKVVIFGLGLWLLLVLLLSLQYFSYVPNLRPGVLQPWWVPLGSVVWALSLSIVPVSIALAILHYRLWDIDVLINRTLVYIPLTAILAGLFAASITLSQKLFVALTGQSSDAATVLTTLIVVATFDPLKTSLQSLVDKKFKEAPNPAKKLKGFNQQLQAVVQVFNDEQMGQRFLQEVIAAFEAKGGAVILEDNGKTQRLYSLGEWNGEARLSAPLQTEQRILGAVRLGARLNGAEYTAQDAKTLQENAQAVAAALLLAERLNGARQ